MTLNEIPEIIAINVGTEKGLSDPEWEEAKVLFIAPRLEGAEESLREEYVAYCYTKDGFIHNAYLNNTKIIKSRKYEGVQDGTLRTVGGKSNRRRRKNHSVGNNNTRNHKPDKTKGQSNSSG